MRVVMIEDDERFGLRQGDLLDVHPYPFEPDCKLTVERRVVDGFVPGCNVYRHMVSADEGRRPLDCTCCQPVLGGDNGSGVT